MKFQALSTTDDFFKNIDLRPLEPEIIKTVEKQLNFKAEKVIWRSVYNDQRVGAFHIKGVLTENGGEKAVIVKIQGPKPAISEVEMIKQFEQQNKSKIIRAPKIYHYIHWNATKKYEVIVMEEIVGEYVLEHGKVSSADKIQEFYATLEEYKTHCITKPWLYEPKKHSYKKFFFQDLKTIRLERKDHTLINATDEKLISHAVEKLDTLLVMEDLEFMHGHISVYDFIKYQNQVIIFSNLFWKYRWPLYDFVFGYMWQILELAHWEEKTIIHQMRLWQKTMQGTKVVKKYGERALNIALLERHVAALNLDFFMVPNDDDKKKIKTILIEEIKRLLNSIE